MTPICRHCGRRYPNQLDRIEHKLDHAITEGKQIMAAQQDIDAAVAALTDEETGVEAAVTALTAADTAIAAEIAALGAQGVDTSALTAAVAGLGPVRDSLTAAVAATAALAPAPAA